MTDTCSNCVNFVSHSDTGGTCHLRPPPWPNIHPDDWCGEYQKGPPKTAPTGPTVEPRAPQPPPTLGTCSGCKYYGAYLSVCRLYPPSSPVLNTPTPSTPASAWPYVGPGDWCGQWVTK